MNVRKLLLTRIEVNIPAAVTVLASVCSLAAYACHAVSVHAQFWCGLTMFIGVLSAPPLLLVNAVLLWRRKSARRLHLRLVALIVGVHAVGILCFELHAAVRYRWLMGDGIRHLEKIVAFIPTNQLGTVAGRVGVPAEALLKGEGSIFARRNADGSVTVWIHGRDGSPRSGYLYHSGPRLERNPHDPSGYFYHLTNQWYEF